MYYFGARYYDPAMGRWLIPDPIDQYYSPYIYCGNNPLRFADFTGLSGQDVVNMAKSYLNTWYEFGGKQPYILGGSTFSQDLTIELLSYSSEVGRTNVGYNINGSHELSIGIDCSGLAGTSFNADPDKLMNNFNLFNTLVSEMYNTFVSDAMGISNINLNEAQEGDLLFSLNSKGIATHVQVVNSIKGNVLNTINAPHTTEKVKPSSVTINNLNRKNYSLCRSKRKQDFLQYNPAMLDKTYTITSFQTGFNITKDANGLYTADK